jgi:hypothetical protein
MFEQRKVTPETRVTLFDANGELLAGGKPTLSPGASVRVQLLPLLPTRRRAWAQPIDSSNLLPGFQPRSA